MPRPDASIQKEIRKRFAKALRGIRLDNGMSLGALSRKVNVSVPMVLKYEQGKSLPSIETIILIGKRLDVPLDTLLGLENPKKTGKKKRKK